MIYLPSLTKIETDLHTSAVRTVIQIDHNYKSASRTWSQGCFHVTDRDLKRKTERYILNYVAQSRKSLRDCIGDPCQHGSSRWPWSSAATVLTWISNTIWVIIHCRLILLKTLVATTVSIYAFAMGIFPLVWGPLADFLGTCCDRAIMADRS
jgi:hypothetical protein